MNVCSCQQIQQAERELIDSGVSALSLMEDAAMRIAKAITTLFTSPGHCVAYLGKGNNAGDALAVLRILQQSGWTISARCAYPLEQWGELARHQLQQIGPGLALLSEAPNIQDGRQLLLLDGLLGLGARLPLTPEIQELCAEMNELRDSSGYTRTWAIDMPTGMDGDTGEIDAGEAVYADFTSVIGAVKKGMLADSATSHVGRMISIPMPGLTVRDAEDAYLLDSKLFSRLLRPRPYEMYKNQAGHVGIIAGSVGMLGAARLCSEAALKAGAGMVTLYCLEDVYPILAGMVSPEILVKPVDSYDKCALSKYDALLIGPGLGQLSRSAAVSVSMLLRNFDGPVVLDADGLNLVASEKLYLPENVLATPHVGEMSRFLPQSVMAQSRADIVRSFLSKHSSAIIYKGARSIISQSGSPMYYNATGGPAMATAGQGDVLSGVCAAFCAQKITPLMAGCLGAHLCGLASDLEISSGRQTERSLSAGDTLRALPAAMNATAQGIL